MQPVPATFRVTQEFGGGATAGIAPNPNPNSGIAYLVHLYGNYQPLGHAGRDIACPIGTPVGAMAAGTVLWADWATKLPGDNSWKGWASRWFLYKRFPGICTVIKHPWGIGVYAHLSNNNMAPAGTKVTVGQTIGLSGNTKAIGPAEYVGAHLHVEALVDLSYSNSNGLIYGRTDPAKFF